MSEPFSIQKRCKSFTYAWCGLCTLIHTQHNMWIHILATAAVIVAGFFLHISKADWFMIIFAVMMVWITESLNTAIEFLCDQVSTQQQPLIKKAKDVAAGSVLIASIGAAIIGIMVFSSYV